MVWSRPAGPPRVWRNVELTNSDGVKKRFSIQEIGEDKYEEAIQHMSEVFAKDEGLSACVSITDDPESMEVYRDFWMRALTQGISIITYEIGSSNEAILAGMNILYVIDKDTPAEQVKGLPPTARKLFKFCEDFAHEIDPLKKFNVDHYLTAYGLSIHPNYRRFGLGTCMLQLREEICKTYNIPITTTHFTVDGSHRISVRLGYEDYLVRPYDDIIDERGQMLFPSLKGDCARMKFKRYL